MTFHFDKKIDRTQTHSYKWDQSAKLFGRADILPLWVADMDFESPPAVKEALLRRAEQGIYGYTVKSESYTDAIVNWFNRRHGWSIAKEQLTDSPGIVTSLSLAVDLYSKPGDAVIVQSPVYYPFYDVIRMNERKIAINPLIERNGHYEMDVQQLEQLMKDGAKLMLLCNPHNPGGRVWSRDELLQLGELCLQYGVTVISDEIHCDLVLPGNDYKHVPFASLSEQLAQLTVTCLAPTKTFNLPGLQSSFVVIANHEMKRRFDYRLKTLSLHMTNFFVPEAIAAAYNEGDEWLDALLSYVQGNVDYAISYIGEHAPILKPMRPEGTYLLWLDCRALGLQAAGLKQLMYEQAGVAFNEGSVFGTEGEGWLRVNLACPRSLLEAALKQFCDAVNNR